MASAPLVDGGILKCFKVIFPRKNENLLQKPQLGDIAEQHVWRERKC